MFWKRKKRRSDDEQVIHPSPDKRGSFRYEIDNTDDINMEICGTTVPLINLSADGAAFPDISFKAGDTEEARIFLTQPWLKYACIVKVTIEVVDVDENNVCRCLFKNSTEEDRETIHKYILERQKADIRKFRQDDSSH